MLASALVGFQVVRGRRAGACDKTDVLGVTVGHPDDVRVDRHEPTRRLLLAVAAFGADVEHDLVARSAFIARSAEHATRELGLVFELERAEKRKRCADVKATLPKVGEYGDARVLPILDRFKITRGCGFVDLGDCWDCLRGTKDLARVRESAEKRPAPKF